VRIQKGKERYIDDDDDGDVVERAKLYVEIN
jgi:hypothetical protein